MYGKYINGVFVIAPRKITEEEAEAQGYKHVVETPAPETDDEHMPVEIEPQETDTEFIRRWEIAEIPDSEPTADDALNILLGGAL
ncbi:MAG: hypothetical protein J6X83_02075 [Methanomicrobium sp.]|nr:hypothetical protein [Methanomicrobium sp.]